MGRDEDLDKELRFHIDARVDASSRPASRLTKRCDALVPSSAG